MPAKPSIAQTHRWDEIGVAIEAPEADTSRRLSHAQIAALNDYEALQLGLPLFMEAWMHVYCEGRVDSSRFLASLTLEPLQHAHPWAVYRRDGARLLVGERCYRLNSHQLELAEAFDAVMQAGTDIARRLPAYQRLMQAAQAPVHAFVRASGTMARIMINTEETPVFASPERLFTRSDTRVITLVAAKKQGLKPAWVMAPKRHYYLFNG